MNRDTMQQVRQVGSALLGIGGLVIGRALAVSTDDLDRSFLDLATSQLFKAGGSLLKTLELP